MILNLEGRASLFCDRKDAIGEPASTMVDVGPLVDWTGELAMTDVVGMTDDEN